MACTPEQLFSLVLNSDYKSVHGNAVSMTFCAIDGFTPGVCTGKLGFDDGTNSLLVTGGAVSDNGDGTWMVLFDIDQLDTAALPAGAYSWMVEITQGDEDIIVGRSFTARDYIEWIEKLT